LYLNLEEPVLRAWCASPSGFLSDVERAGLAPDALFLEEAQRLQHAGLFVKGVVDLKPPFPVVVTGSSSFHLDDRVRESLAGRATRHVLLPFSLAEAVPPESASGPAHLEASRREAIGRALRLGSYPEAWLSESPEAVLTDLLQAVVLRDASDRFAIERPDAYQKLLILAAGQVGNLVNQAEYAALCGVTGGTIAKYLDLLEQTHIVRLLSPFAEGGRREVTGARKVFFIDNGLRHAALGRLRQDPQAAADRGALVENWVYGELAKNLPWTLPIRYWRSLSGAEVDFVLDAPQARLAIEVKAGPLSRAKLTRGCRSFVEAYTPGELWVLNDALEAEEALGETRVRYLPLHRLPEAIGAWREGNGIE
jgi:predicted AAA+ superfamily ATPase